MTMAAAGLALAVMSLTACDPSYAVRHTEVTITLPCNGAYEAEAQWAFPDVANPAGVVWLQHGFARSNDALIDLMKRYSARGFIVLNPSIGPFGTCGINSATQHQAIASVIAGSTSSGSAMQVSANAARSKLGLAPITLPTKIVLSGHSAGAAAMTTVGGILASSSTPGVAARLRGVVLLDPVENADGGMAANLPKLASKPVLTISGPNSSCNSNSSGTAVLLPRRSGFAGVRLPTGCHCDAEADSTDTACTLLCGTPKQANKDALRQLATDWVADMIKGTKKADAYPGGANYEKLRTAGTITTLTGTA